MKPQDYYAQIRERFPFPISYDQSSACYVVTTVPHAKTVLRHVRPKAMSEIVVEHDDKLEGHRAAVGVLNTLLSTMKEHDVARYNLDLDYHVHSETEHLRRLVERFYRMCVSVDIINEWLRPAVSRIMFDLTFGRHRKTWGKELYTAAYDLVKFLDGKYKDETEFIRGMSNLKVSVSEHLGVDWNAVDGIVATFCRFAVGHETPANIVANIVAYGAGMRTPQGKCISEAIRFDPPIQTLFRYIDKSVTLDGIRVHAGQKVCIHLGLASRDKGAFIDPESFSAMNTTEHTSMFFGSPTNGCPGRHTAFDIVRCLLDVIDHVGQEVLPESILWLDTTDVRGMDRLMVRFAPLIR